jgi:N-acetyl-anhydromuramyl-L-alanine amidase AmpD
VIHHTASEAGSVESIHEAHIRRKDKDGNPWLGIGYHFVIGNGNGMGDGEIESTFRWKQQMHGAHAGDEQHNQHGIGISLVGNFDKHPPTTAQLASVKRLVSTLKIAYGISSGNVIGHAEIKATACPGKYFPMAEVSQGVRGFPWQKTLSAMLPRASP